MSTRTTKPSTAADFWALLAKSRLFDAAMLAELKARFEASGSGTGAAAVARWLGGQKRLTSWQAQRLLRGEAGPFFLGDYRLLERLESGGSKMLLRAVHVPSSKGVMLALLDRNRCGTIEAWTGIVKRTAIAHQASNPMLSRTWALEQADGNRFVVCEDVRGQSLRKELAARGAFAPAEAGWIAASLARAAAELHAAGMVHGGISLDTILRDPQTGAARLLQFPLVGDPHDAVPRLPLENPDALKKLGPAAAFIAPECILGGGVLAPPADVYAIGCVLAALLTARLPCWKGTAEATIAEAASNGFNPPEPPVVPLEVSTLIGYLTARDPSARYGSAGQAAEAIAACFNFPQGFPQVFPPGSPQAAAAPAFDSAGTPAVEPVVEVVPTMANRPGATASDATRRARARAALFRGALSAIAALALVGVVIFAATTLQAPSSPSRSTPQPPPPPSEVTVVPAPAPETVEHVAESATPTPPRPATEARAPTKDVPKVALVDDPNLIWDSPTHGPPLDLAFLPPGSQGVLVARLQELLASDEGAKFLKALGPSVAKAIETAGAVCGCGPEAIVRVLAAWQTDEKGAAVAGFVFDLDQPLSIDPEQPPAAWGRVSHEPPAEAGEGVFRGEKLTFWLPSSRRGKTLVVAPQDLVTLMIDSAGAPSLTPDLERLAERLDDQRHVICFGSPAWLDADSRDMLSGPLARLAEPLAGFFGPGVSAAALSLHFGATGYAELMAVPPGDQAASALARSLSETLDQLPERIEHYCTALDPHPFGRTIVLRLPSMVRAVHANLRHGAEDKLAILNCHLPAAAPHNIALAGELALEQQPSAGPKVVAAEKSQGPASGLQKKISLVFAKDTLERSIQMLSDEIGVPMEILGGDLQLEGITKNQSFGLDERDVTGDAVLRTILAKADSGGRLVYVVREKDGGQAIEITTRAAAAKRGDTLPPGFEKPK